MPRLYSFEDVYEEILPFKFLLNIDQSTNTITAAERAEIDANLEAMAFHFDGVADIVRELQKNTRAFQSGPFKKKNISRLNDNLFRVAGYLLNSDNSDAESAAIEIAALAVAHGGNVEWAQQIFDKFDKIVNVGLRNLMLNAEEARFERLERGETEPSAEEIETDTDTNTARGDIAEAVFDAMRHIAPGTAHATLWHQWAVEKLRNVSEYDTGSYEKLITDLSHSCDDPKRFPGALAIFQDTYDDITLYCRRCVEEDVIENTDNVCRMLGIVIVIDAQIMATMAEIPHLFNRAKTRFDHNCCLMNVVDYEYGQHMLRNLRGFFAAEPPSDGKTELVTAIQKHLADDDSVVPQRPESRLMKELKSSVSPSCLFPKNEPFSPGSSPSPG